MTPAQALSIDTIWQQWEGRIVNARFPLLQYLGGSRRSAFYLTELAGAKAVIKLIPAGTPRAAAQVTCWKLAGRLSHPNLVSILEIGLWHADQEQDMCFAVMEHCDESLAELLRQRLLTPAEAREVLVPTLGALKYLHSQGLLHGQIKPAHLLASGDQLKLSCDTIHRNGEGHPSAIESPYDAPEKAAGTISLSGDVWSLGITLFEALTGHLPGAGKNGDGKAAEKLPPPFDAIVAGCLVRERDRRLSLSAIRAILDKPARENSAESKLEGPTARTASNVIVLPTAATVSPEPVSGSRMEVLLPNPVAAAGPWTPPPDASKVRIPASDRRRIVLVVAAVFAVLAIAVGLRLTRKSTPAPPTAGARHSVTEDAPATVTNVRAAPVTSSAGAVLQQVMPVVSSHARSTISGTVKVKLLVAVAPDGRVSQAKLAAGGPSRYFANQALEAVRKWTFEAPIRDGNRQASEWAIHFEFRKSGTKVRAQPRV